LHISIRFQVCRKIWSDAEDTADPILGMWAYAALKQAVAKMYDYLQDEHPDLSFFNVQPGVVETDLNKGSGQPGQDAGKCLRFHKGTIPAI
jgi:hypothetical protein